MQTNEIVTTLAERWNGYCCKLKTASFQFLYEAFQMKIHKNGIVIEMFEQFSKKRFSSV